MNFDFSDDMKLLRDQARKFLREHCPPKAARRVLEGEARYDTTLWRRLAEMGWLGAAVPEDYGGAGLGYEGLCVLAEELGAALAPVPFASSAYLATEAILAAGSDAQKQAHLPKLAGGDTIGTLALAEGPGNPNPARIAASVTRGKLSGTKLPVADGGIADLAVVLAQEKRPARPVPGRSYRPRRGARDRRDDRSEPRPRQARLHRRAGRTARRGRRRVGADPPPARPRRGADRLRADRRRPGLPRHGARLCAGTLCLRPADRLVPGDQA
ncbi:MAG: acyl-CoA dehydrogenase family protein [Aliidongia sp.]